MTKRILVTYATNAGSTREVAEAVAEELRKSGAVAEACPLTTVTDLSGYGGVVIGAPMIVGWHRDAAAFLRRHREELSRIPVALFFTAMSLTKTGETELDGVPLFVDPQLAKEPRNPGRPGLRERWTTVKRYVGSVLRANPSIKPVSVGVFGGKLDFGRLKLPQMLFVMLIVQAQPGDRRNWDAIREWAATLAPRLNP